MITYLNDQAVESVNGGLDIYILMKGEAVTAPAPAPAVPHLLGTAVPAVTETHSLANIVLGSPQDFDAGSSGIGIAYDKKF